MLYRVVGAMVTAVALKLAVSAELPPERLHVDVHGIAAYVGVVGALYGIIVAFLIFVVWDQFNRVQTGLDREASALEDLCRVAGFLSDPDSARRIRLEVKRYIKAAAGDEPQRLAKGQVGGTAQETFGALCHAVRAADVKTEKDGAIYDELLRAVARVIDARDARLSVSSTRIPRTLWNLVLFASCVLFGGFLALGLHSFTLSLAVVAAVAGTLTFLLSVIKDMDNPFVGAWNVSYAPLTAAAARIG